MPLAASHTRAVLSQLAVTTRVSSGAERGAPHFVLMLQRRGERLAAGGVPHAAVFSALAVTTRVPSGLNAALHALS